MAKAMMVSNEVDNEKRGTGPADIVVYFLVMIGRTETKSILTWMIYAGKSKRSRVRGSPLHRYHLKRWCGKGCTEKGLFRPKKFLISHNEERKNVRLQKSLCMSL